MEYAPHSIQKRQGCQIYLKTGPEYTYHFSGLCHLVCNLLLLLTRISVQKGIRSNMLPAADWLFLSLRLFSVAFFQSSATRPVKEMTDLLFIWPVAVRTVPSRQTFPFWPLDGKKTVWHPGIKAFPLRTTPSAVHLMCVVCVTFAWPPPFPPPPPHTKAL